MSAHASAHAQNRPCRTSTEALAWAWRQQLPPVPKLALLNLASGPILAHADEVERVHAAMRHTVADTATFCSIDQASAWRTLDWLVAHGYARTYAEGLDVNWEAVP